MPELLIYLAKGSLILFLFYGVYVWLLRTDTHFDLRRYFLLLAIGASFLLPLLQLNWFAFPQQELGFELLVPNSISTSTEAPTEVSEQEWTLLQWFQLVYALGIGGMLLRMGIIVWQMTRLFRTANQGTEENVRISSKVPVPFSFFRYIFLPENRGHQPHDPTILQHERLHIRSRHSWDVLLAEGLIGVFWFHPFSWLLKRSLQEVHEYQVDAQMLHEGVDRKTYQFLLLDYATGRPRLALANTFNQLFTKKRIVMMNKAKSPRKSMFKYVSLLPLFVLAISLMAVSSSASLDGQVLPGNKIVVGQVLNAESLTPIVGATVLIRNSQTGTITDQKGKFLIEIPEGSSSILEFSYINMGTHVVKITEPGELTVFLSTNTARNAHKFEAMEVDLPIMEIDAENPKIRIKANGDESKQPLFVVDGKIMPNGSIKDLEPEQIEVIEVLKGEAATKEYGIEGENGVIIVTTKQK